MSVNRRDYLKRSFAIGAAGATGMNAAAASDARPNLLFIMTDQQRFDAMSLMGNEVLETPHMDRVAREGVLFKRAYAVNPVCVPSRAALLTGLSPSNSGVEGNGDCGKKVPYAPTFDGELKKVGYAAEYYGKWHTPYQFAECYDNAVKVVVNEPGAPRQIQAYQTWLRKKGVEPKRAGDGELFSTRNQRPYEPIDLDWNSDAAHLSAEEKRSRKAKQVSQYGKLDLPPKISYVAFTADETLRALERLSGRPFTLTCSFDPPHPPMVVQEPYFSMYPPDQIEAPASIDDPMTHSPYQEKARKKDQLPYRDPDDVREMRSIYYGMVREVDDWIGVILDKLDELKIAENTMVVFVSDHGEMLGDHGMHSKVIFYEGSARVPLAIRFPGRVKAGAVVEQPVSTLDLAPTILDYMGVKPMKTDGISLRPMIEGQRVDHDVVTYSVGSDTPNYALVRNHLKLMMGRDEKSRAVDALYDLEEDPLETRNLLRDPQSPEKNREQALEMKGRLIKWLEKHEPRNVAGIKKREIV